MKHPPRMNREIRQRIVNALPLIRAVAMRMHKRLGIIELEELMSVGLATLVDAVRKYDPARATFSAYFTKRLYWAMTSAAQRFHKQFDPTRGLPSGASTRYLFDRPRAIHVHDDTSIPSLFEIGINTKVGAIAAGGDLWNAAVSLAGDPEQLLLRRVARTLIRHQVAVLPVVEHLVVKRHYYDGESFVEIARSLGRTNGQVCRIHRRALRRLADALRANGIEKANTVA